MMTFFSQSRSEWVRALGTAIYVGRSPLFLVALAAFFSFGKGSAGPRAAGQAFG